METMMRRLALVLALASLEVGGEEPSQDSENRLATAARAFLDGQDKERDNARSELLATGTKALPALRSELKQRSAAGDLSRLAGLIEVLEPAPKEREAMDSIDPFALSPGGAKVITYRQRDQIVLMNGGREFCIDPGIGPLKRVDPTPFFRGEEVVAVIAREKRELCFFRTDTGEKAGTLDVRARVNEDVSQVLPLGTDRLVATGRDSGVWICVDQRSPHKLTIGRLNTSRPRLAVLEGRIVGLFQGELPCLVQWDTANSKMVCDMEPAIPQATLVAASSHSQIIVVGSTSASQVLVSLDGKLAFGAPRASGLGENCLESIAVSPDGAWIALGSTDGRVLIRLSTTWEQLAELKPGGKVTQLAFSDDGTTLGIQAGDKLHIYTVRSP